MKVELQCGDTIAIPNGCKAIIKDGSVVFESEEKEEKVQGFKDGDIVILCGRTKKDRHPFIFKREDDGGRLNFYIGIDFGNILRTFCDNEYYNARQLHHATDKEKQILFEMMKEQGLQWNAEKKRVERIRWRAGFFKEYCYVGDLGSVLVSKWNDNMIDEHRFNFGNCFRTIDQAEEAAKRVRKVLLRYHEELGNRL